MEILNTVKKLLGIVGNYQDETLIAYIDEIQKYLLSAGVNPLIVYSKTSAGTIARGVIDLWNYGSGDGKLSPYFKERVIQLSYREIPEINPINGGDVNELSS